MQFRGFTPKDRDNIVASLGNKITVQESPWDCILLVAINHEKKPFDDKRVRRALTLALDRYTGSKALSQIAIVKEVARVHGASLSIERAASGIGTVVQLLFPYTKSPSAGADPQPAAKAAAIEPHLATAAPPLSR